MDSAYALTLEIPPIDDFRRLRAISGMKPRSLEAAAAGLPGSLFGVVVRHGGVAVGIGRVIGDGGLVYQISDVAVDPAHQGKGLGKAIMAALMTELRRRAPAEAYVNLIADGEAHRLYAQYGFAPVQPESIGMAMWLE